MLTSETLPDLATVVKDIRAFVTGNTAELGLHVDPSMLKALLRMDIFVRPATAPGLYLLAGYTLYQEPPKNAYTLSYGKPAAKSWLPIRYRQAGGSYFGDTCLDLVQSLRLPPEGNMLEQLANEAQVAGAYSALIEQPTLCYTTVRTLAPRKPAVWLRCEPAVLSASKRFAPASGLTLDDEVLDAYRNLLI